MTGRERKRNAKLRRYAAMATEKSQLDPDVIKYLFNKRDMTNSIQLTDEQFATYTKIATTFPMWLANANVTFNKVCASMMGNFYTSMSRSMIISITPEIDLKKAYDYFIADGQLAGLDLREKYFVKYTLTMGSDLIGTFLFEDLKIKLFDNENGTAIPAGDPGPGDPATRVK